MALLLLIRHGLTDATGKRLYGRGAGVHLSPRGRDQADRLARRIGEVRLEAVYSSPLERCLETAEPVAGATGLPVRTLPGVLEVDVGRWTGRTFASLRRTKGWRLIHETPSATAFPGGESLADAQHRTVAALEEVAERHPRGAVAVVSHGDPIRLALAHYAGLHLDLFRRLEAAPGSVSAVAVGRGEPRVLRVNDTGALDDLAPPRARAVRG
ncbi:MAG TPA: MSMEG_4193 family putative phosphomutase [Actinomycetota bacterium]|nr:MSMEG_4193 family putative phosphomutase [Actinomycetota bacterium]